MARIVSYSVVEGDDFLWKVYQKLYYSTDTRSVESQRPIWFDNQSHGLSVMMWHTSCYRQWFLSVKSRPQGPLGVFIILSYLSHSSLILHLGSIYLIHQFSYFSHKSFHSLSLTFYYFPITTISIQIPQGLLISLKYTP